MSRNNQDQNIIKKFLDRSFRDPISALLLKNSCLTNVQYETLVIDIISNQISDILITYDEKTIFRSKKVSRGAFSRTLSQARKNVISAIYTILLLNYIGIFEGAPFEEYQVLSEKLREYNKIIINSNSEITSQLLKRFEAELVLGISEMAKPKSIKIL